MEDAMMKPCLGANSPLSERIVDAVSETLLGALSGAPLLFRCFRYRLSLPILATVISSAGWS